MSMIKAEDEKSGAFGASDLHAVNKLLDDFSKASISDVAAGPEGGGGALVHPPKLRPAEGGTTIQAWKDLPPPPPQVNVKRLPAVAQRAAAALGTAVAQADVQTQMLVLRSRLQEYVSIALKADLMEKAHADFKERKGKAATTDREVIADLNACVDGAKGGVIKRGWDGGGGARVVPPRPRPPPAQDYNLGRTYLENEPARPLRLGAVPLSLIEAVHGDHDKKKSSGASNPLASLLGMGSGKIQAPTATVCAADTLAPHLGKLLKKLDRAVEGGEAERNALTMPVRQAAKDMFMARHAREPADEVEGLNLLRTVLEEGGVRVEIPLVDRRTKAVRPSGGGIRHDGRGRRRGVWYDRVIAPRLDQERRHVKPANLRSQPFR